MAWINWGKICMAKREGGLGVKNLEVFNIALLTKWRWRILTEEGNPLWKEILTVKYGLKGRWPTPNEYRRDWGKTSLWWRDLCQLGEDAKLHNGWFNELIHLKLGRGNLTRFWKDRWLGTENFSELFPSVYNACRVKDALVEDMGRWDGGVWRWEWDWTLEVPSTESLNVLYLKDMLLTVSLDSQSPDHWRWKSDIARGFSVKSCYLWLADFFAGVTVPNYSNNSVVWSRLWRQNVPSKVQIFAWRVMLDRIATRDALFRKGVLQNEEDRRCAFCLQEAETPVHLFLVCIVAKSVWRMVFRWMGAAQLQEDDLVTHFMEFGNLLKGRKLRRIKQIIWLAVIWNLWMARNKRIFKGEVASISSVVAAVKDTSWGWFKARQGRGCEAGWEDWYNCPTGVLNSLEHPCILISSSVNSL